MELQTLPDSPLHGATSPSFIIQRLINNGWSYLPGRALDREDTDVVVPSDFRKAVKRIHESRGNIEAVDPAVVLAKMQRSIGFTQAAGLVGHNKSLMRFLKDGVEATEGTRTPIIDYLNHENNILVVSDDVTFKGKQGDVTVFDLVLWINGMPLVVGEIKDDTGVLWTDAEGGNGSWVKAAETVRIHETTAPEFFSTNIISFAVGRAEHELSGTEFHFGAVQCSVEHWELWGSTADPITLSGQARVERSIELLLNQSRLLSIIQDFTLYGRNKQGGLLKITPRYPQVEAVESIYRRALEPGGKQGLIVQHQGTGKTLAMVFSTIKLYNDPAMGKPTIFVLADRTDLVEQTHRQFVEVGIHNVSKPNKGSELEALVQSSEQNIVLATIQKFGKVNKSISNDSHNIIVLIDEAHRTQEGSLGEDLRRALPNARFFGFTGTPVIGKERNTFKLFGDPTDPGWVINEYLQERSIADGTVVRIHIDSRAVQYHLADDAINEQYEKMLNEYGADDAQSEKLMAQVEDALFVSPERIKGVCESIVEHYYTHIAPNGMKAQIVAANRTMCVLYDREIKRILGERGSEDETAVVMSYNATEDGPKGWGGYKLNNKQVNEVVSNFNNVYHPLKFLIVTSMLCTGFDAPIEGVMYIDKKLKSHNLFQTMSRVNRKWKNPVNAWRKPYGMVVDYVGLGSNITKAFAPVNPDATSEGETIFNVEESFAVWSRLFHSCLQYFKEFTMEPDDYESIRVASKLASESSATLHEFVYRIGQASDLWEALYPDERLEEYVSQFAWMVAVYRESLPKDESNKELLQRLGAKTLALIHANINDVTVSRIVPKVAVLDAAAIAKLREQGIIVQKKEDEAAELSELDANDVDFDAATDSAMRKLKELSMDGDDGSPYMLIGDRLKAMYESYLEHVIDAARMLHELLNMVGEITEVESELLEFEEKREAHLPVILKNLMSDVDGKSMNRLVREIEGMAAYFSGLDETVDAQVVLGEVVGAMERLEIHPENKMVAPVLTEYVMEACRAAALLNR